MVVFQRTKTARRADGKKLLADVRKACGKREVEKMRFAPLIAGQAKAEFAARPNRPYRRSQRPHCGWPLLA